MDLLGLVLGLAKLLHAGRRCDESVAGPEIIRDGVLRDKADDLAEQDHEEDEKYQWDHGGGGDSALEWWRLVRCLVVLAKLQAFFPGFVHWACVCVVQ